MHVASKSNGKGLVKMNKPVYKRLQGENKHSTQEDQPLTYAETHLPLTHGSIRAILDNPGVTFQDCDALYFSLLNGDASLFCQYSDEVLRVQRHCK